MTGHVHLHRVHRWFGMKDYRVRRFIGMDRWNELDLFGRPLGKFTEPANFYENRAGMGFGSEAET